MKKHNCKIGRTYPKYPGYGYYIYSKLYNLTQKQFEINRHYLNYLRESGKINKIL